MQRLRQVDSRARTTASKAMAKDADAHWLFTSGAAETAIMKTPCDERRMRRDELIHALMLAYGEVRKKLTNSMPEARMRLRDIVFSAVVHAPEPLQKTLVQQVLSRRVAWSTGRAPDLSPPKTFNEHILHRIIHDRDPRLKIVNDKLAVRQFIAASVGDEFVVPLLGAWSSASAIEWDRLPRSFVLKPSHSSGLVEIVKDASSQERRRLERLAASWLTTDYFHRSLEWGYQGLPRNILAEPMLKGPLGEPAMELQIQVVCGTAVQIGVITGEKGTADRYGDWFFMNGMRHPGRRREPLRHAPLPTFIRQQAAPVAEKVAAGFDQMRVDFYVTSDGLKIGELTPYHSGGHAKFDPPELDLQMGEIWTARLREAAGSRD